MNVGVYNPNKDVPFNFNLLLHTYFKCPDVRRCQVRRNGARRCPETSLLPLPVSFQVTGLLGCTFIDKTREPPNTYQVSGVSSDPLIPLTVSLRHCVISGVPRRGHRRRVDRPHLHAHAAGAHHHERGVAEENAHTGMDRGWAIPDASPSLICVFCVRNTTFRTPSSGIPGSRRQKRSQTLAMTNTQT
jgi:hypothetical protein